MNEKMQSVILEMMNKMGGIEQFQSNPFAFIGEILKNPELMGQLNELSQTPEMQEQIAASMNSPMFQQMVANNPTLSAMMDNYKARKAGAQAASNDVIDADTEHEDEITIDGYDFSIPGWKAIDWLNPISNQPFYVPENDSDRVKFSHVLQEIPEECRDRVEIIADKRLSMHLNDMQRDRVEEIAQKYGLHALDLMASQGFIGEVCYCASLIMPEDDLCDLAKFALATLHRRSGFPVPSYITQILLYIDSFDDIDTDDWENFVWSLSANPVQGRDGNFDVKWDDAMTIAEIAAENLADAPELRLAVVLALLNWTALDIKNVENPLKQMLTDPEPVKSKLAECLEGKKHYAINLMSMRQAVIDDAKSIVEAQ